MDTTTWITLAVLAFIIIFAFLFRKHIHLLFKKWWTVYQEQKKFDELYNRLDRNKAGKFNTKEYRKSLNEQKKNQMKKNRDATVERREVKGK